MNQELSFIAQELEDLDKARLALAAKLRDKAGSYISLPVSSKVVALEVPLQDLVLKAPLRTNIERLVTCRMHTDVDHLRHAIGTESFWSFWIPKLSGDLALEIERKIELLAEAQFPVPEKYLMQHTRPEVHIRIENYQLDIFLSMCLTLEPIIQGQDSAVLQAGEHA